ncbi:MAG: DUF5723 family protein [Putridiphycobacter sp.]|nr:DUF5723 family protein [Putridiphycobacter sp.]
MKITITVLSLICCLSVFGQNYPGYSQNNYAGVHAGFVNPAFLADNRLLVDVNVMSLSFSAFNDYLYFSPRNMPYGYAKTFLPKLQDQAALDYTSDTLNGKIVPVGEVTNYREKLNSGNLFVFNNSQNKPRNLFYNHEIAVLNVMVSLDQDVAFSFGIKQRTFVNLDYIPKQALELGVREIEAPEFWNILYQKQDVKLSFNTWNEYAVGLASVVYNKDQHFVKTGINLKYLQGLAAAYISTSDLQFDIKNGDTANFISGAVDYSYSDNLSSASYGIENIGLSSFGIDLSRPFTGAGGNGFAADIGVVYEWRPKYQDYLYEMDGKKGIERPDLNKYKLRLALSLNDIGGIRYKKAPDSRKFAFADDLTNFDFNQLSSSSLQDFNVNVASLVSQGQATYLQSDNFFMNTPTHITASVDYMIFKNLYVNANSLLGFAMRNDPNRSIYRTNFSITPRYEHSLFALAIPVSYATVYGARVGLSARISPFLVLGTSNLVPFFSAGKDVEVDGADFYMAIKVPIRKRLPRDTDGDLVSDKVDLCVNTAGVWQFRGCPDTDGDGVQDSEDRCPGEPGKIEFNGCPDSDNDGIIDLRDDCVDVPGLPEFNGCPDTDGDKIIDSNDDCPTVAGIIAFNGCPDSDGDGIKDSDDLCPNNAGPKENNGCPDTDSDGLFDYLDDCPKIAGPKENKGCPWPDTDEDGILDKDDKCPLNKGPKENNGCPYIDTDGDGILDKDDACVNVPGVAENMGCPLIEEEEKEILQTAFNNLEFETGKAIIKDISFESLDRLAELLNKKPDWKIKITGHTDSQGGAQNNLILSKKRAESVSTYLASKGISTADRVVIAYFGEEKPIADNSTPEGRQTNRRVEMDIIFE